MKSCTTDKAAVALDEIFPHTDLMPPEENKSALGNTDVIRGEGGARGVDERIRGEGDLGGIYDP